MTAMRIAAPVRRGQMNDAMVQAVQMALLAAGAELRPDGDFGTITETAVKRFQAAHAIAPSGQVDAETAAALNVVLQASDRIPAPAPSVLAVAPWLSVMRAITGTKELPGAADSPIILGWAGEIIKKFPNMKPGIAGYTHDSIPWCGFGMAYCLTVAGYRPPLEPLWAANFMDAWPDGMRLPGPALGAIMVFRRPGGNHVGLYEGEDADHWQVRGCNQSDQVSSAAFSKHGSLELRGFMWAKSAPFPLIGKLPRQAGGASGGKVV